MKISATLAFLGLAAIASNHVATASDCSFACIDNYDPVCASDGITYSNLCYFNLYKCSANDPSLTVVSEGECGSSRSLRAQGCTKACTKIYDPVCGSDGTTYGNPCEFDIAKCLNPLLTKVSDGECPKRSLKCGPTFCTADYAPVCGSDGKTYSNLCWLQAAQCQNPSLTVVSDGECPGYSIDSVPYKK